MAELNRTEGEEKDGDDDGADKGASERSRSREGMTEDEMVGWHHRLD